MRERHVGQASGEQSRGRGRGVLEGHPHCGGDPAGVLSSQGHAAASPQIERRKEA